MLMSLSLLMCYQEKLFSMFIVSIWPADPSVPHAFIKRSSNHLPLAMDCSSSKAGRGLQLHALVTDA